MNKLKPYHRFLIKNRVYCQHPGCLDTFNKATQVVKFNGMDEVMCYTHARRLADVRKSERKQESTIQ